jgi:hypothetical protein
MWFYSARKMAAIVALSSAMIGIPNTTSAAPSLDPVPTLELDMRNASPDESTSSSITIPAGTYAQPDGQKLQFADEAKYSCVGKTNNPHWSRGTGGVIAKTVVTCSGPNGNIPVRVLSLLGKTSQNSVASLQIVAESNYVQNIPVGALGQPRTWYVPAEGAPRISGDAYFRASHSVAGAPPLSTEISGSGQSTFLYVRSK